MKAHLQPLALLLCEHGVLDHLSLDRHASEAFEAEPDVAVELVFGLGQKVIRLLLRPDKPPAAYRDALDE